MTNRLEQIAEKLEKANLPISKVVKKIQTR